jgi:hypothetical protein
MMSLCRAGGDDVITCTATPAAALQGPALAQLLAPQMASNIGPMGSACACRSERKNYRVGPKVLSWLNILTVDPYDGLKLAQILGFYAQALSPSLWGKLHMDFPRARRHLQDHEREFGI